VPSTDTPKRFAALDGLRGLAALAVVFCHVLSSSPTYNPLTGATTLAHTDRSLRYWLVASPLHLLWNGSLAVILFFVLSGFVLTLPLMRALDDYTGRLPEKSWRSYYPRRLLRLYLPVAGALLAAYALVLAWPRHRVASASDWLNSFCSGISPAHLLHDLALLAGVGSLDPPLWSLRQEVVCSLLLPAFFLVARVKFVPLWTKLAGCVGFILAASSLKPADESNSTLALSLTLLGAFGLGALLASDLRWKERLSSWSAPKKLGLLLVSVLAANSYWTALALGVHSSLLLAMGYTASLVGGAGLIVSVLVSARLSKQLCSKAVSWLGARSFSLYLSHLPVLIALALAIGPRRTWLLFLASLPVLFVVAELFYRVIERPSHRLSAAVGRRLSRP